MDKQFLCPICHKEIHNYYLYRNAMLQEKISSVGCYRIMSLPCENCGNEIYVRVKTKSINLDFENIE